MMRAVRVNPSVHMALAMPNGRKIPAAMPAMSIALLIASSDCSVRATAPPLCCCNVNEAPKTRHREKSIHTAGVFQKFFDHGIDQARFLQNDAVPGPVNGLELHVWHQSADITDHCARNFGILRSPDQ